MRDTLGSRTESGEADCRGMWEFQGVIPDGMTHEGLQGTRLEGEHSNQTGSECYWLLTAGEGGCCFEGRYQVPPYIEGPVPML